MVDIPERTDDAADVIIYGVESEQIEEENDAYNDMRYELGINKILENEKNNFQVFQEFIQTEKMNWRS